MRALTHTSWALQIPLLWAINLAVGWFQFKGGLIQFKRDTSRMFFCRSNLEQTQTKGTISVKISLLLIETAIKLTLVVFFECIYSITMVNN